MKSLRKINCFFSCLSETFCKFLKALKLQRSKTNKQTNKQTKIQGQNFRLRNLSILFAKDMPAKVGTSYWLFKQIWVYQVLHDATKALPRKIHPTYHHVVILR